MARLQEPIKQTDFLGGMTSDLNVTLAPRNTVDIIMNMDADEELGSLTSRLGTAQIGSQLVDGNSILGLHQHVDHSDSSNNKLFAAINASGAATSVVYDVVAGTTVKTGLTASKKMRFLTFLGETLAVNGADAEMVWNGNGLVSSAAFTAATTDIITSTAHNLADGNTVTVTNSGGALPAGLAAGTIYFVRDRAADTFKVALTSGGTAVDITDTGTGTHTWHYKGAFDLVDFPGSNSCELTIEFLDRVYAAGDSSEPDRVHFSSIASSGAVVWNGDFVDIEPEDGGGPLTAFAKVPGYILIFKERSLKRFNGSSAFPESLVQIGAPNQESVIMGGGLAAFYSNSNESAKGFYITNGGRPECISQDTPRPIKKWVDAIAAANEDDIAGWATDRTFNWSVGDLTVDGETYTNVVFRYNRILNQWTVRSYPTEFKFFAPYLVSSVNTIVGGDDDGNVIRVDKSATYTDAPSTAAISYKVRTHHDTFGHGQLKSISDKIVVRGKNLEGMNVSVIPNEDTSTAISLSQPSIFKRILGLLRIGSTIEGTTLAVDISGSVSGARATIREIELPHVDVRQTYD